MCWHVLRRLASFKAFSAWQADIEGPLADTAALADSELLLHCWCSTGAARHVLGLLGRVDAAFLPGAAAAGAVGRFFCPAKGHLAPGGGFPEAGAAMVGGAVDADAAGRYASAISDRAAAHVVGGKDLD